MANPRITIRFGTAGISQVNQALAGLRSRVLGWAVGIGGAMAAALGTRRLVREFGDVVQALDAVGKTSEKLGITADALLRTRHAANLVAVDIRKLDMGLQRFIRRTAEAATGTGEARAALAELGIEARSLNEMGLDDKLDTLAEAFAKIESPADKVRLAFKLFDSEGVDLIRLLNLGADGLAKIRAEAEQLGLTVGREATLQAAQFNDNLYLLQSAAKGVANTLSTELLPFLVDLTTGLVRAVKENDRLGRFSRWLAEGIEWLARAVIRTAFFLADLNGYLNVGVTAMVAFGDIAVTVGENIIRTFRDVAAMVEVTVAMLKSAASGDLDRAATYGRIAKRMVPLILDRNLGDLKASAKEAASLIEEAIAEELGAKAARRNVLQDLLNPSPGGAAAPVPAANTDLAEHETPAQRTQRTRKELADQASAIDANRFAIANRIARIENDRHRNQTQQYRESLALRRDELAAVEAYVAALEARLETETDINAQEQIRAQIDRARRDQATLSLGIDQQVAAGDPASIRDQFFNAADDISRRIGTLAQQLSRSFTGVMDSLTEGIAGSLEGLITRTMDWADALRNVARTIGGSIVSSISRMAAEWITKRLAMMAKNIFATKAEGAAETAAKTPGAVLTSISSYGVAAVVGLAAVMAALASIGAFASGGLVTGPGGPTDDQVLARLSAGEYVINADAVAHYGTDALDALNARAAGAAGTITEAQAAGATASGTTGPGANPGRVGVFVVDDRRQIREHLERDPDFERWIIKTIRDRRIEIG